MEKESKNEHFALRKIHFLLIAYKKKKESPFLHTIRYQRQLNFHLLLFTHKKLTLGLHIAATESSYKAGWARFQSCKYCIRMWQARFAHASCYGGGLNRITSGKTVSTVRHGSGGYDGVVRCILSGTRRPMFTFPHGTLAQRWQQRMDAQRRLHSHAHAGTAGRGQRGVSNEDQAERGEHRGTDVNGRVRQTGNKTQQSHNS